VRDATGLSYLRARYYDATLGRFLSRDTWAGLSGLPATLNRATYVGSNPTTLSDPSGLKALALDDDGQSYKSESVLDATWAFLTKDMCAPLTPTELVTAPATGPIQQFLRANGDVLKYNAVTNEFVVSSANGVVWANGVIRTFFKPTDGAQYWLTEIGKAL
jgi:RHS repeat-associated protein